MDRVVRHAIAQGLTPMAALQMATINTAEHFGVSRQVGMIAPGRWANIVLVKDLNDFRAELVLVCGKVAAEHGKLRITLPITKYPAWATKSVHLKKALTVENFKFHTRSKSARVSCNVIGVIENQAPTKALQMSMPVKDGRGLPGSGSGESRTRGTPPQDGHRATGAGKRVWFYRKSVQLPPPWLTTAITCWWWVRTSGIW